jgi:DNA-binding GntR family transcriptional regulator
LSQQGRVSESRRGDPTAKLRALIVSGKLTPNERLVEAELVSLLRSNRTNVRTALARLEQEGLVVSEPNRGARVRLVSGEEAIEITQARGALEILVVRQAAENVTKSDRIKLRRLAVEMRSALDAGDLIFYSDLNGQLHTELYRIASLPIVTQLLLTLKSQLVRFQYRPVLVPGRAQQSIVEHTKIVEAVCDADPDRAERAMREHLAGVLVALRQIIKEKPNTAV